MSSVQSTNPTTDKGGPTTSVSTSSDIGHDVKVAPKESKNLFMKIWDVFCRLFHYFFSSSLEKREVRQMQEAHDAPSPSSSNLNKSVGKKLVSENRAGKIDDCHSIIKAEAVFQELPSADPAITCLNWAAICLSRENDSEAKIFLEKAMQHESFPRLDPEIQLEAQATYIKVLYDMGEYDAILGWQDWSKGNPLFEGKSELVALINVCIAGAFLYGRSDDDNADFYCDKMLGDKSWFEELPQDLQDEILDLKAKATGTLESPLMGPPELLLS